MNCREFEDLLGAYIDQELESGQLASFEQHRRDCALCAMLVETLQECRDIFRDLPEVDPPPELSARILAVTSGAPRGVLGRISQLLHVPRALVPRLAVGALGVLFALTLSYNLFLQPGNLSGARQAETDLVSLLDYSGNRAFTRVIQVYEGAKETWQGAVEIKDRAEGFVKSHWQQVKSVFRSDDKKKKEKDGEGKERRNLNQTRLSGSSSSCNA